MKKVLLSSLSIIFVLSSGIFAQLDPAFNGGRNDFSVGTGGVTTMAAQPDNKIVLLGYCTTTADWPQTFCVIRVNEDGTQDTGSFTSRFIRHPDAVWSSGSGPGGMALQSDGKIVISGHATFADSAKVVLTRLNTDGSTDSSFGTNGFVVTDVNPSMNDYGGRIAIQPDGKIVMAGSSGTSSATYQGFVARYLPDGALDAGFAAAGIFTNNAPGVSNLGSIVIQPDGKIIAGGGMQDSSAFYLLMRLNSNGTLDTSWDGDGYKSVLIDPGPSSPYAGFGSIGISLDGGVAALGVRNDIYRFNADGSADTGFDGDGVRPSWYDNNQISNGLMVSASGRITVVGRRWIFNSVNAHDNILSTAKFLPNGSPDTSFSEDGFLFAGTGNDAGYTAALDSKGRTIVGGLKSYMPTSFAIPTRFFAVRYTALAAQNVAISGRVTRPDGAPVGNAVLLQDGAGNSYNALTNPFGFYIFSNIPSNKNYTVSAGSKKALFSDRSFFLDDTITNFSIVTDPPAGRKYDVPVGLKK